MCNEEMPGIISPGEIDFFNALGGVSAVAISALFD